MICPSVHVTKLRRIKLAYQELLGSRKLMVNFGCDTLCVFSFVQLAAYPLYFFFARHIIPPRTPLAYSYSYHMM